MRNQRRIHTWLDIEHHLHRFLPKWNHCVEAGQIEVVLDKVLRDLAEVFVTGKRAEPADPRQRRGRRR